ncbi:MAG: methyltransferase domain-containing protein [Chitinophagales bacterium]|nr:methyltransferase domain-containing protein [Chitinophagales bacterium]MDW8273788.1 methyltransferase domain-containing protein [Chitinophagales bacterium]
MEIKSSDVKEFYDEFIAEQIKDAYNRRHFLMLEHLKKLGLNAHSNVLEIGCGIGVITSLIANCATEGKIFGIDISPRNIDFARKIVKQSNVEFAQGDAVLFNYPAYPYDFITLFDVLEHIPAELHAKLFQKLSSLCNENTTIIINIPAPELLQYFIDKKDPNLQILDQPLSADFILKNAYDNGLRLTFFEEYGIWHDREYHIMYFKKRNPIAKPEKIHYNLWQRALAYAKRRYWNAQIKHE